MKSVKLLSSLALAMVVVLSACGQDDEPEVQGEAPQGEAPAPGMQGGEMDPEMMELMMEMQTIEQELGPIQQQALEDEALAEQLASVQMQVDQAMREEDPELFERIETFEAEIAAAQEAGDEERLQALGQEAQGLQQSMQTVQASVLERPDVREPVEAYEEAHRARMIEIDPEAEELLDRAEEIMERLSAG